MTDDQRPETFDDLHEFQRERETVARIELTPAGFAYGLGTAVDHLVNAYGEIYADGMTVDSIGETLYVYRDRTEAEMQETLDRAQRLWDRNHPKESQVVTGND